MEPVDKYVKVIKIKKSIVSYYITIIMICNFN